MKRMIRLAIVSLAVFALSVTLAGLGGYSSALSQEAFRITIWVDKTNAQIGDTVTWSWQIENAGSQIIEYSVHIVDGSTYTTPSFDRNSLSGSASMKMTKQGTYHLYVGYAFWNDKTSDIEGGDLNDGYVSVASQSAVSTPLSIALVDKGNRTRSDLGPMRGYIGDTFYWNVHATGGSGRYSFRYVLLDAFGEKTVYDSGFISSSTYEYRAAEASKWRMRIEVRDDNTGETASMGGDISYLISALETAKPLTVDLLSASNWTPAVGDTVTWTWDWSGGNPPYNVDCYVGQEGSNGMETVFSTSSKVNETSTGFSYTFTKSGNMRVLVVITSSDGQENKGHSDLIAVSEKGAELKAVTITPNHFSPAVGASVTWTVEWSGGKPPYTVNAFAHLNDNQRWEMSSGSVNGTSYSASYTLNQPGIWASSYKITSADGQVIECNGGRVTASVQESNSTTFFRPITGVDAGYAGDSGLDVAAPIGTPVYAIADGTLEYSQYGKTTWTGPNDTAYSLNYKLDAPIVYNGKTIRYVYYTHLSNLVYSKQDGAATVIPVKKGELIGYSGIANGSPHLHITLYLERSGNYLSMAETRAFFGSHLGMQWKAGDGGAPQDQQPPETTNPESQTTGKITITPLLAYNRSGGNTTTYEADYQTKAGAIYGNDLCTILEIQQDFVRVEYPVSGGTKTKYSPVSDFFFSKAVYRATVTARTSAFTRSTGDTTIGTVFANEAVYAFGSENGRTQIAYNVTGTPQWKLGWVSTSLVSGSAVDMPSGGSSDAVWPTVGGTITQGDSAGHGTSTFKYNERRVLGHAIDIAVPVGTDVFATKSGTIHRVADLGNTSFGKYIYLRHDDGTWSAYCHLSSFLVREGDYVAQGQTIAKSGNSGNSTGPHLHFEITDGQFPTR